MLHKTYFKLGDRVVWAESGREVSLTLGTIVAIRQEAPHSFGRPNPIEAVQIKWDGSDYEDWITEHYYDYLVRICGQNLIDQLSHPT